MTIITFALEDESRPFLKKLTDIRRESSGLIRAKFQGTEVGIFHVGMGRVCCEARLQTLVTFKPSLLILAGVAGALNPDIEVGAVYFVENFSTKENATGLPNARMLTLEQVVDLSSEKIRLYRESGAELVDMETQYIAEVAAKQNIPVIAIRAVSDDANHDFPVPSTVLFDEEKQRPRIAALVFYLLTHPAKIGPFIRFVRNVSTATSALAQVLSSRLSDRSD